LPVIRTKPFEPTWKEFLDGWQRCHTPCGSIKATDIALADAIANPPEFANLDFDERIRLLAGICYYLDRFNSPFYLSCREAARVLGLSGKYPHRRAHELLHKLEKKDVITCVKRGAARVSVGGKASFYQFNPGAVIGTENGVMTD
jgi:hypothetical protein